MEPPIPVSFDPRGDRLPGWQLRLRVDYVVNQLMQTHRGLPEEEVAQAMQDRLRGLGATAQPRQVQHFAGLISQLPPLPPRPH